MKKLFYVVSLFTLVAVGCALGDPVVLSERLAGYARSSEIPTNVSELTNDEGYVNQAEASDLAKVVVNEMAADGWDVGSSRYQLVVQEVPSAKTTFTLVGGVEEVVDISGTLDQQWMVEHGYCDEGEEEWLRPIVRVNIGTDVTGVGEAVFYNCSGLTSVDIPDSVTSIGEGAFAGCSGLVAFSVAPGNPQYSSANGLLLDKDGTTVLFGVNGDVTIPDSVTRIGVDAFSGCAGLTSVTIPDSVTSIGGYAFNGCGGLTNVTIGNSVTNIESYAFSRCAGLTNVTLPDSVMDIWTSAFSYCSGLTSVDIPDGVVGLGAGAFRSCGGLTNVIIGNSVMNIGHEAFSRCAGLTSVTIPNSVTNVGNSAFSWCTNLTSVAIGDSVTSIGNFAFSGCTGLTSVAVPDSVMGIGGAAFRGCSGLMSVTMSDKTASTVRGMSDFSWDLPSGCIITCSDGTITVQ